MNSTLGSVVPLAMFHFSTSGTFLVFTKKSQFLGVNIDIKKWVNQEVTLTQQPTYCSLEMRVCKSRFALIVRNCAINAETNFINTKKRPSMNTNVQSIYL